MKKVLDGLVSDGMGGEGGEVYVEISLRGRG